MANEFEELKLSVSITGLDQATQQLDRFKRSLRDVGELGKQFEGASKGFTGFTKAIEGGSRDLESANKRIAAIATQTNEFVKALRGGPEGMLGFVQGFGALGVAVGGFGLALYGAVKILSDFVEKQNKLGQASRSSGMDAATLKVTTEAVKQYGLSMEDVTTAAEGAGAAMLDISRNHEQMINRLRSSAHENAPFWEQMFSKQRMDVAKHDYVGFLQDTLDAINEYRRRMIEQKGPLEGAKAAQEVAERYGLQKFVGIEGFKFPRPTPEDIARVQQLQAEAAKLAPTLAQIDEAGKTLQNTFVRTFGSTTARAITNIATAIEGVGNVIDATSGKIDALAGKLHTIGDSPVWKYLIIPGHTLGLGALPGTLTPAPPGRQHGGPVGAGHPYMVGEAGPELFIPNTSGIVSPSSKVEQQQALEQGKHTNDELQTLNDQLRELNKNLTGVISPGGGAGGAGGAGGRGGRLAALSGGTGGGGGLGSGGGRGLGTNTGDGATTSKGETPSAPQDASGHTLTPKYGEAPTELSQVATGGGGKFSDTGDLKGTGPHGQLNDDALYKTLYNNVPDSLIGVVPKDGAHFGITTGSRAEWAKLQFKLAKQESSGQTNPASEAGHTGTAGLFQFEGKDLANWGQKGKSVTDPMAQIGAMNKVFADRIKRDGYIGGAKGRGAGDYFGPLTDQGINRGVIAKHEREGAAVQARNPAPTGGAPGKAPSFSTRDIAGAVQGSGGDGTGAPPGVGAGAVNAPSGAAPSALIIHHTAGGRGETVAGIVNYWRGGSGGRGRGIGTQYIMDRDGHVHNVQAEFGYSGHGHFLHSVVPGVSNQTAVGIEVMAKNDADMTSAQLEGLKRFAGPGGPYASTRVLGHSQVSPHDRTNEGVRGVQAIEEARRGQHPATAATNRERHSELDRHYNSEQAKRHRLADAGRDGRDAVTGQANIHVKFDNVPANVKVASSTHGSLFKNTTMTRSPQLQAAHHDQPKAPDPQHTSFA